MEELKGKLENEAETIWDKAYGMNVELSIDTVFDMYDELLKWWEHYFIDSSFYYDGYRAICEALGDAYFMYNTDGPEQNDVIYRLLKLVEANPGDNCVKKLLEFIKLEKIKKDFE